MNPLSDSKVVPLVRPVPQLPTMMIVGEPQHLNIAREAWVELELGWEVVFAGSAFDTLDIPTVRTVDIVLLDMGLPHLDAAEVVAELHQRFPRLPIVLMSAPYAVNLALEAMRQGACNHFPRDLLESEPTAILDLLRDVVRQHQQQRHTLQRLEQMRYEFTLSNDRSQVLGVVQRLKQAALEVGVCDHPEAVRLGVALEEAILNAMIHGNLEISSELRQENDSLFDAMIRERSQQNPYAQRCVRVVAEFTPHEAQITIADDGPGFDVQSVPDPTSSDHVSKIGGRGILLMRAFTNGVHYNDRGNTVTLTKKRR